MKRNAITPRFRWVDSSKLESKPEKEGCVEYEQLEITISDKTEIIGIHDSVLLCSDDNPKNDKTRSKKLETFVARIEKMWEEPDVDTSASNDTTAKKDGKGKVTGKTDEFPVERTLRMKIRARWYFKKKDMQSMRGTCLFPGINRRNFLNSMTPQMLILGEQSDDNEVATILSKCKVLQCRPENAVSVLGANKDNSDFFICSHTVYMPKAEEEGFGTVLIHPFDGDDQEIMKDIATPVIFEEPENKEFPKEKAGGEKKIELTSSRKRPAEEMDQANVNTMNVEEMNHISEDQKSSLKKIKTNLDGESTISDDVNMNDESSRLNHTDSNKEKDETTMDIDIKEDATVDKQSKTEKETPSKEATTSPPSPSKSKIKPTPQHKDSKDATSLKSTYVDKNNEKDDNKEETKNVKSNKSASSSSEDDETTSSSQKGRTPVINRNPPTSPKITVKEGAIHVGPNHQATIPPMPNGSLFSRIAKQRNMVTNQNDDFKPTRFWTKDRISEDEFDRYKSEAALTLKKYMNENGIETVGANASTILMGALGDGKEIQLLKAQKSISPTIISKQTERKPRSLTRECNEDKIISTLHESAYDISKALNQIKKDPLSYLIVWTSNEKESFNNGFRRYRGSLRSISKGVPSKTYKDVVDYHYRFKIPTQFRRYQEKKREQAKRMMGIIDDKGTDSGYSSGRKSRSWTKVGAHEQRKVAAKDFLIQVRDTVGPDNYLLLAAHLKMYQARNQSVSVLKENVAPLLHSHTSLLEKFLEFLPKKYRA